MAVARDKSGRSEKNAPTSSRPGLWINLTRPGYYMGNPRGVSRKEFARLFHNDVSADPLKWNYKTLSARSCGLRLEWRRDDAGSSLIYDDNGRLVAGEADGLEPGEKVNWSCGKSVRKGDLSLFYRTAPAYDIRYLLMVTGDAEPEERWKWTCDFVVAYKFPRPLLLEEIRDDPFLWEHMLHRKRPTFYRGKPREMSPQVWRRLNEMLAERNPSYPDEVRENWGVDIFAGIPPLQAESPVVVSANPPRERTSGKEASEDADVDMPAASPVVYERMNRPEQPQFRKRLIRAYGGRCAVTGESTDVVLNAAHLPGRDHRLGHNHASDGILLRVDLHCLLDEGMMTFTSSGVVQIAADAGPEYRKLHGRTIRFPKRKSDRPAL